MESVTLYYHEESEIKISIEAYFESEMLVIDGCDMGPRVKEYWGDSDYEYIVKVPAAGVSFLYKHFNITNDDKGELLQVLAARYNTNTCYSDIRQLLDDHHIQYEGFTWTWPHLKK